MNKIKKAHKKIGKCFNRSFARGFGRALNAFGNITQSRHSSYGSTSLSKREASHYRDVSGLMNESWNTVGHHMTNAVLEVNESLGSSKLPVEEIKNSYDEKNASKIDPDEESIYLSNNREKIELKNGWG